jgi:predicted nucleic acid-binding protein
MKPTVYIETTIPSYYYNQRKASDLVVLSQWTRDWWDNERKHFELVTSLAVIEELEQGRHPLKKEKLDLISSLKQLEVTPDILATVEIYIKNKLMPNDPQGDALHLALASHYKCDILLSWNCKHIVNYQKTGHLVNINKMLGLPVPVLLTPFDLLKTNYT